MLEFQHVGTKTVVREALGGIKESILSELEVDEEGFRGCTVFGCRHLIRVVEGSSGNLVNKDEMITVQQRASYSLRNRDLIPLSSTSCATPRAS